MSEEQQQPDAAGLGPLSKALIAARKEINHPPRNKVNPHFRNRYADLTAVLDAVIPVFNKHGLTVAQMINGTQLLTLLIHESGGFLQSAADIPTGKPGPQALGSALTYMRRYTIQALAGIAADDDDDGEGSEKRTPKATQTTEEDW